MVFVKTLAGDGKYPVQYCDNLHLSIQMQLSEKRKLFLDILLHFWNLPQILKILKKPMMVIVNVFSNVQTVKSFVTPLYKKRCFRTRLDSRHVQVSRILAKSP